jgi:hypothetical protein
VSRAGRLYNEDGIDGPFEANMAAAMRDDAKQRRVSRPAAQVVRHAHRALEELVADANVGAVAAVALERAREVLDQLAPSTASSFRSDYLDARSKVTAALAIYEAATGAAK